MHEVLVDYFNARATRSLSVAEVDFIKSVFTPRIIRKRQYFLVEGEVCRSMGFIIKGAMRQYRLDDSGAEHVSNLYVENWWVADRKSFGMSTPSIYHIDAWEATQMLCITQKDMIELKKIPAILEVAHKLDENNAIATQKRLDLANSMNAKDRYTELMKIYPDFFKRFPQYIIASYLGIRKETLSRARIQTFRG